MKERNFCTFEVFAHCEKSEKRKQKNILWRFILEKYHFDNRGFPWEIRILPSLIFCRSYIFLRLSSNLQNINLFNEISSRRLIRNPYSMNLLEDLLAAVDKWTMAKVDRVKGGTGSRQQ